MHRGKRITQRDLAAHLGVSQVTVSRALARNPLVNKAMQEKIWEAANRLGYTPDPVLGCLNAYRQTRMPIEKGQTLAWITGLDRRANLPWYLGASKQAEHYGYRIRDFDPDEPNLSFKRLMSILYNQGISGLIFPPRRQPQSRLEIDLDKFCAVTIGYSLQEPAIDRVITDHHINCIIAYDKLVERGYRRIAYATALTSDQRLEGRELSALIYQQSRHPHLTAIPPLLYENTLEGMDSTFPAWIRKWRPDVIICSSTYLSDICERLKLRVPEDIGIISLMVRDEGDERSGMNQLAHEAGVLAVDTVVSLLRSNQRGVPRNRRTIMLAGEWVDGKTTHPPPIAAGKSA